MRTRIGVAIGLLAVVGGATFWWLNRGPTLRPDALENAPEGTVAIVRMDVNAVLESSLWRHFVTDQGGDRGLQRLREQCGFDPTEQIEELSAFVLGEAESLDHVVFAARGPFDFDALGGCMQEVMEADGGGLRETEVAGVPALAGLRGESRIAILGRSGLLFGQRAALTSVIANLQVDPHRDEELSQLWSALGPARDVEVVARVPDHWRPFLERLRLPPEGQTLVTEVLANLRAFAATLRVRRGFAFGLVLRYADTADAQRVAAALTTQRERLLNSVMISLSPAGPALRAIALETNGAQLTLAADLNQQRVDRLLELYDELQ